MPIGPCLSVALSMSMFIYSTRSWSCSCSCTIVHVYVNVYTCVYTYAHFHVNIHVPFSRTYTWAWKWTWTWTWSWTWTWAWTWTVYWTWTWMWSKPLCHVAGIMERSKYLRDTFNPRSIVPGMSKPVHCHLWHWVTFDTRFLGVKWISALSFMTQNHKNIQIYSWTLEKFQIRLQYFTYSSWRWKVVQCTSINLILIVPWGVVSWTNPRQINLKLLSL